MDQNVENIDFHKFTYSNFTTMVSPEIKTVIFEFLGTFLIRSTGYLSKVALFFEKIHTKSSRVRAKGAVLP